MDQQGTLFSLILCSLPLTGLDLVLGIQWLELLGYVVCNWKQLTMESVWKKQTRRLKGIDGQDIQAASLKELSKEVAQAMQYLHCAYKSPRRSDVKIYILAYRRYCRSSLTCSKSPQGYHLQGKLITALPLRREPSQLMFDHTSMRIIKKKRLRSRFKIC